MLRIDKHAMTLEVVHESQAKVAGYTDEELRMKYYETLGLLSVQIQKSVDGDPFAVYGVAIAHWAISREIQIRERK